MTDFVSEERLYDDDDDDDQTPVLLCSPVVLSVSVGVELFSLPRTDP